MPFNTTQTLHRWLSRCAVAATATLGLGLSSAQAAPGLDLGLAAGTGSHHAHKLGLVLGWTRPEPLWQGAQWRLMLRHEAELAHWHVPGGRDVQEVGYSPVLRLEHPLADTQALVFLEGSIGVRLLSHTHVGQTRLGTAFQFSDQLGVGAQWGELGQHTVALRLQHISNGSIKQPNPGINFWQLAYHYRF